MTDAAAPQWVDPTQGSISYPDLLGNLVYLFDALLALTGGTPVDLTTALPTFGASADGTALVVSLKGNPVATISLPFAGAFKGPYASGITYVAGNIVQGAGSAFSATATFKATTLAQDLKAGNLVLFCSRGAPAVYPRGAFNANVAYNLGDGVTYPVGTSLCSWTLIAAAPAGTVPAIGSQYWALVAIGSPIDSAMVTDATYGVLKAALDTLSKGVAAAKAAAAQAETDAQTAITQANKAQANAAAINQQLGQAKVAGFPLATFQN